MLANEKDRLLALFARDVRWCQDAEARDAHGAAVRFHDPVATAWDITGGMCCLFGWKRACILFGQVERHIHKRRPFYGNRNAAIASMVSLQAYNDQPETVFELVLTLLKTMPVWTGVPRPSSGRATVAGRVFRPGGSTRSTILHKEAKGYAKIEKLKR